MILERDGKVSFVLAVLNENVITVMLLSWLIFILPLFAESCSKVVYGKLYHHPV